MWNITREMQKFIRPQDTVLDLMCGKCAPTRDIKASAKVGVDLNDDALREAAKHCIPMHLDARVVASVFPPQSFDVVLWLDGIEHLEERAAVRVLGHVEKIARRAVVVHTPDAFFDNKDSDLYKYEGELQVHRSFFPEEFWLTRGYRVVKHYYHPTKHNSLLVARNGGA